MREAIFGYTFPAPVPVPTPEWPDLDGQVYVRTISAAERDAYEDGIGGDMSNARAKLVVLAACDAKGQPIFQDGDADRIGAMPSPVISRLWYRARRLSVGEGVEGAAKN